MQKSSRLADATTYREQDFNSTGWHLRGSAAEGGGREGSAPSAVIYFTHISQRIVNII
jgi:hypothetical protein